MAPQDRIRFEFISSYDGAGDYRIMRYGHKDHERRVTLRWQAPDLYNADGTRRLNYTDAEYKRDLVAVVNWLQLQRDMGDEYGPAFERWTQERYREARTKHERRSPDYDWSTVPAPEPILGVARWDYGWHTVPLAAIA